MFDPCSPTIRCVQCPRIRPRVLPDNPVPARVLFLGEAPNEADDKFGRPFVGRIGVEFVDTYLPLTGLVRSECCIYYARCCSTEDYENPTLEEAVACSNMFLNPLLNIVKPQILVAMGAVACAMFPEIGNLNLQHGIPLPGRFGSWQGVLFPTYHPNAGINQTGYMISLMKDFDELGKLQKELQQYV